jgi:hypothetical protein
LGLCGGSGLAAKKKNDIGGGQQQMRPIRGFLLITALAGIAAAAPLCTTATMAVYDVPGFSCQISDKIFSEFTYAPSSGGNGVAVPDTAVTLTPDFSNPSNPGFHFSSSAWTVSSLATDTFDSFVDSTINFRVTVVGNQPFLEDNTLTLDSFFVSGPGAFAAVDESYNPDPSGLGLHVNSGPPPTTVDHSVFPNVSTIHVTKDLFIGAEAGTTSTASISQFSENFSESQVPEPMGFVLLGSGLLGLGVIRRRR